MASWNGTYFEDENTHSYNFVPMTYPENNIPSYSGTPANWSYYPVAGPVSQPPVGGLQNLNPSLFTAQPMQTVFRQPVSSRFSSQSFRVPNASSRYSGEINSYSTLADLNLEMAASSTLTPTAGEFIPRPPVEHTNPNEGCSQSYESSSREMLQDSRQNQASSFINCERNAHTFRKPGNNDSKYFPSNRGYHASGYNRVVPFNNKKSSNVRGIQQTYSNRPTNMEKSKNDDRQRLLAEAAAFLSPTVNADVTSVSDFDNVTKEIKQHNTNNNSSYHNKGRNVTNSNKQNDIGNSNSEDFSQHRESFNYAKKKIDGNPSNFGNSQNFKSGSGHMSSDNVNGSKHYSQYRMSTESTYYGSPRRNVTSCGETVANTADDDASQRERLTEQLSRGTLECLVCCDRIRQHDAVWSCNNCYHVLHLKCIKKWAKSSKADSGWRCPACQNVTVKIPYEYRCFCGKVREPEWNRMDAAHTCGQMCGRSRSEKRPDCTHRCNLLCHPGPCPTCVAQVNRSCGCGRKTQVVKCGSDLPVICDAECERKLNCGLHFCTKTCHVGDCPKCEQTITQECYCGKIIREVPCEFTVTKNFSCDDICDQKLSCGNHTCNLKCHPGPCCECELTPDKVKHCPCGRSELGEDQIRTSCLDIIPTCGRKCNKKLSCGQPGSPHTCQLECHNGPCPICPLTTLVKCRCGNMDREIPCNELTSRADDARCEKKCTKKRSCGKHKCNQLCCIEQDHICPLICNHQLTCGQHRCEEPCHRGHCAPCWRTSFEELYCECGSSVLYPPIACGTRRPECSKPCSRTHSCEHPALHNCHSQPVCPPCTVLTQKYCFGKHELRKSIPCHQTEFSCGLPCNMDLPCGHHRCILPCHKGPCLKEGKSCIQPCTTPRNLCGHNCAAPCHVGPCPDTPCKEMVKVTCECGHRSTSRACSDNAKEYQRIATSLLASKMADMQLGHSVDIGDMLGNPSTKKMSLKTLECSDECRIIERNRRLAIGLQIRNPDLSAKLTPRYSEFMRQWAKKDPHFCNMVHEKLTELVKLAKQSKQKSRSYSFDIMNKDKRHFVHEYCEHFGCESVAYDKEPKRNIVATAAKDKAWLPSMSLLEVIQRENGQRKIPKPVITSSHTPTPRAMDVLPVKCSQPQVTLKAINCTLKSNKEEEEEEVIDYFDFS